MNPYAELAALFADLARAFPIEAATCRPLRGDCDLGDTLIVERRLHDADRVVRIIACAQPVRSFYWGHLPKPGEEMDYRRFSEGNVFGNPS